MPWRVRRKGAPDTLATGHQVLACIARPAGIALLGACSTTAIVGETSYKSASVRGRPIQRGCHATEPDSIAALPTVPSEQDGAVLGLRGIRRSRHRGRLFLGRLD